MSKSPGTTNYWKIKYLDKDAIDLDIRTETKKVLMLKDIFIITKGDVLFATNNPKLMLRFICKYKPVKHYDLISYLDFLKSIHHDNCKWRTYKQMRVIKYHNTIRLTKLDSIHRIYLDEVIKNPMVQQYFREQKLERILKDDK